MKIAFIIFIWLWCLNAPAATPPLHFHWDSVVQLPAELDTSALFKRGLFDVISSPTVAHLAFASAGGVFLTRDGRIWKSIPRFGKANFPLAIAQDGTVFVGGYFSPDNGQHFFPYVRWEKVIKAITRRETSNAPQDFRMLAIHLTPIRAHTKTAKLLHIRQRIALTLESKNYRFVVRTSNFGENWRLVSHSRRIW